MKIGQEFFNGLIKVIDKDTIEIVELKRENAEYNNRGYCTSIGGYLENKVIRKY